MPLALPWIVFVVTWAIFGLATAAAARTARPLLGRLAAEQRAALLLALALLPVAVATAVTALGFSPRIGGLLVDRHCHPGVGCVAHVPILHTTAARATLLAIALFTGTGGVLWSIGSRLRRSVVLANTLSALAERGDRGAFKIVESDERFAYCLGLVKPQLLVSRGLLSLPPAQRDAVLAHEYAHAARRDNLRRWLAGLSLLPLPRALRTPLLDDLAEANEQACDRAASAVCGHRALEAALTALAVPTREGTARCCAPHVANRVSALARRNQPMVPSALLGGLIAALYVACTLTSVEAAHHGTEFVLSWLVADPGSVPAEPSHELRHASTPTS
jgi:hypothetical protein